MSDLPPDWTSAPLATIANVQLGRQRSPENHSGPNMRPYLRAANVTWGGLALGDVKEMNFSFSEAQRFRLTPGDILLSEASGSASEVGKPAIWTGGIDECYFQNTLIRVRAMGIDPSYLLWFFKWLAFSGQFAKVSRGVGIHHLGAKGLSEWIVPIAPFDMQKLIVAEIEEQFSRLDAGMTGLGRVKQKLARMHKAHLDRIVGFRRGSQLPPGWRWATVRDMVSNDPAPVLTGPFGTALSRSDFKSEGIPVLTIGCLTTNGISLDQVPRVSLAKAESLHRYTLEPGDVLFSRMATVGRAAVVTKAEAGSIINYHLMRLRLNCEIISPEFMVLLCRGSRAIQQYLLDSNHGVTRPGINTKQLLSLPVALPSIAEQKRAVSTVHFWDDVIYQLGKEVDKASVYARQLRSSILAAAFSGKLI